MKKLLALFSLVCLMGLPTAAMVGCQEEEGPAERMGRGMDEAGQEMEDTLEDVGEQQ